MTYGIPFVFLASIPVKAPLLIRTFSAEAFNEFVASNFQASFDLSSVNSSTSYLLPSFHDADVYPFLLKAPKKSCGLDGSPPWTFRSCTDFCANYLAITSLFNTFLSQGCIPGFSETNKCHSHPEIGGTV